MNIYRPTKKTSAFTLTELVIVLGVSMVIAWLLLWPRSQGCKARPERIHCVNNLRQIGVAFNTWASDHNGNFPMQVSFTNHGTSEAVQNGPASVHYRSLSNEIVDLKLLVCPADKKRPVAKAFASDFDNSKLSYFVGVNAHPTNFNLFLSGDRNITNGLPIRQSFLELNTTQPPGWTDDMHQRQGNVGLADGSVQQFTSSKLREAAGLPGTVNRLAMP